MNVFVEKITRQLIMKRLKEMAKASNELVREYENYEDQGIERKLTDMEVRIKNVRSDLNFLARQ